MKEEEEWLGRGGGGEGGKGNSALSLASPKVPCLTDA